MPKHESLADAPDLESLRIALLENLEAIANPIGVTEPGGSATCRVILQEHAETAIIRTFRSFAARKGGAHA